MALEKELRQAHERCANLDEKLRHVERELQRALAEKQSLQQEVSPRHMTDIIFLFLHN